MGKSNSKLLSCCCCANKQTVEQQQQQQQLLQMQKKQLEVVAAAAEVNDREYMAIHNFVATQPDEVSINRGDMLEILSDEEERKQMQWWRARNLETKMIGLVPFNYITRYTGVPCLIEGWSNCNRMDANRRLLCAGLKPGTYIIRPCAKKSTAKLALSIRTPDSTRRNNFLVKHYQIKSRADGSEYFIKEPKIFPTVQQLIDGYRNGGLCSPLTDPCPDEPPVVQFKDIEVNRETIDLRRKLGAGSFGDVWMAKWNGILDVAVKTLKSGAAMTPEKFLDEAKLMHKLSHPKIVNILGVCTELRNAVDKVLIITEFMENGSLLDYLRSKSNDGDRLQISTLLDMAYQIADGMSYLEEKKFVHRDLRAANVLVGKDNYVKVADFGLARVVQDDDTYTAESEGKFPVKWTAPEAMFENRFTTKSDVWSFGVLLYEILTHGGQVYCGMNNREVMEFVRNPKRRLEAPITNWMTVKDTAFAKEIYDSYMKPCWHQNPEERPTFMTLRNELEDIDKSLEQQYSGY